MRLTVLVAALLLAAPCLADHHYVLMIDPTNVPHEVQELTNRSHALFTLDQTSKSLELQQEALRIHRRLVGNDSPELIGTLEGLIDAQAELKQDAAMETCREILRLASQNFPKSDYRVRSADVTLRNIGHRLKLSDDDQRAITAARRDLSRALASGSASLNKQLHLERSIATFRRCLGPASCEARMSRIHLCNALVGLDKPDEVIDVILNDLDAMRAEYGAEHPFYAEELAVLCMSYTLKGEDDLAIQHGRIAMNIFQVTGCTAVDCSRLMQSFLIVSLTRRKQYEEAAEIASSAVRDIESHPPVDSEALGKALLAWASVYNAQEAYEKMVSIQERLVKVRRDDGSGKAIELAEAERQLATTHLHLGRFADAEPLFRHAIRIYENQNEQPKRQEKLILCHRQLGECLIGQKRWEDAIGPLEIAHRKLHASVGTGSSTTRKVRDDLAAALRAVGRDADADRLTAEARPFPPVAELSNGDTNK